MKFIRVTIEFFIGPYVRLYHACAKRWPALAFTGKSGKTAEAAPAPFTVALSDFEFRSGCGHVYAALSKETAQDSLSEEQCEALDLQLVWARHPDYEKSGDYMAMAVAALKEYWLWRMCAATMRSRSSFYHDKALRVAAERMQRVNMLIGLGGQSVAEMVRIFARLYTGSELAIDAWRALANAHGESANIASGFHVFMGYDRWPVLRLGTLSLTARRPVFFGGPQTRQEATSASFFRDLAIQARRNMVAELASQHQ